MHRPLVLVVEDEPAIQTTLCATLTMMGFASHHATTVEEALTILGTEHIDAVTLDVRLPDWSNLHRTGLTLLAFLRATAEYATIPVLIFTGVHLTAEEAELARRHNAHVFYKPQPYSVLIEHLEQALGHVPAA